MTFPVLMEPEFKTMADLNTPSGDSRMLRDEDDLTEDYRQSINDTSTDADKGISS